MKDFPKDTPYPTIEWLQHEYGNPLPPFVGVAFSKNVSLFINDPEIIQELFVTKNKYFDKHDFLAKSFLPLVGNTMLF